MSYVGDIAAAQILYFKFVTTAPSTGAPTTPAGSPAISVYKDDGTTESTSGVTLSTAFDGVVGLNSVKIDTSSDGTFYAAGHDFQVVITTGTVSGVSAVGYVVGEFSIANRISNVTRWLGTAVTAATAGVPDVNVKNMNNVAATSITTINANQGTTQPVNFTGTAGSALVKSDTVDWAGTAVSTPATAGVVDVNVKNINNVAAATPGASGGILISGSNSGTTTLGALTVTGVTTHTGATVHTGNVSMAAGLTITQSVANTNAVSITGNGTGNGIGVTSGSGATGDGIHLLASSTNGSGLASYGNGTSPGGYFRGGTDGLACQGVGVGAGIALSGGATNGPGFYAAGGANGPGAQFDAGAGNAVGLVANGTGTGDGLDITAGATGAGAVIKGGATSGLGMQIAAQGSNTNGLQVSGFGGGCGALFLGGATGDGADFQGGATSGDGISSFASAGDGNGASFFGEGTGAGVVMSGGNTNGDGLKVVGKGSGLDIDGTDTANAIKATINITQAGADKVFGPSGAAMAELPVAAPSATPNPHDAAMLVYMTLRNKLTTTSTQKTIFNDAGTQITSKGLSDNGVTYTETEMS